MPKTIALVAAALVTLVAALAVRLPAVPECGVRVGETIPVTAPELDPADDPGCDRELETTGWDEKESCDLHGVAGGIVE